MNVDPCVSSLPYLPVYRKILTVALSDIEYMTGTQFSSRGTTLLKVAYGMVRSVNGYGQ